MNNKKIPLVRGFRDICGERSEKFQHVFDVCIKVAKFYNVERIFPPIVENTELFQRSLGESSDVVKKELFLLENQEFCLAPEKTASILRYVDDSKRYGNCFYIEPCFRYERPQQGRYRQFFQFGVEFFKNDLYTLFNIILDIFEELNIQCQFVLNFIGTIEERKIYIEALKTYFQNESLSELSKERLKENAILRILDSKEPEDQEIIARAPKILEYVTSDFTIADYIRSRGQDVLIEQKLVRGLDYYENFVFEMRMGSDKSQNAIGGGGEYEIFNIRGIGFAIGIDRLVEYYTIPLKNNKKIAVVQFEKSYKSFLKQLIDKCSLEMFDNLLDALRWGNKNNVQYVIIAGSELEQNMVSIKNLKTGKQDLVFIEDIKEYIQL